MPIAGRFCGARRAEIAGATGTTLLRTGGRMTKSSGRGIFGNDEDDGDDDDSVSLLFPSSRRDEKKKKERQEEMNVTEISPGPSNSISRRDRKTDEK